MILYDWILIVGCKGWFYFHLSFDCLFYVGYDSRAVALETCVLCCLLMITCMIIYYTGKIVLQNFQNSKDLIFTQRSSGRNSWQYCQKNINWSNILYWRCHLWCCRCHLWWGNYNHFFSWFCHTFTLNDIVFFLKAVYGFR